MTKIVGPWHCSTSQIVKWLHAPRFVCHCKHPRILAFSHILLLNTYIKSLKSANITRVAYLTEVFIPTHPSCLLLYVHRTRGERARAPSNANLLFSMYHFLPGTRVSSPFSNKKIETQAVTKMQRSRIRNNVFFSLLLLLYIHEKKHAFCILNERRPDQVNVLLVPSKLFRVCVLVFAQKTSWLWMKLSWRFYVVRWEEVKQITTKIERMSDMEIAYFELGLAIFGVTEWCTPLLRAISTLQSCVRTVRRVCIARRYFFFFIPHHPQSIYLHSPRGIHRHWVRSFISLSILPTIAWMQTTRTWRDCQNDSGGYNHKIRRQWKTFVMRNMYSIMPFILNVVVRIVGHKDIRPEVAVAFTRKALYRSAVMRNDKLIIGTVLFWNWNQQDFRNHNDMFASLCGCVVAMQIFRTQVHSMFQ